MMAQTTTLRSSLPRWVRPEKFEPPHGCLLRLAECNGLPGTNAVLSITGLRVGMLRIGRDLDLLATVLNCDVGELEANSTAQRNNAQAVVSGHILRPEADLLPSSIRRVCPACVAQSAHQRTWWDWSFVSTCPTHGCMLVDQCSCGSKLSWKDGCVFKCYSCQFGDVRDLPLELVHPRTSAPDLWAIERFTGGDAARVEFLDDVPLGYAAEMVKRIGMLDLFGYRLSCPTLAEPTVVRDARARGFDLVRSGAVGDALDRAYGGYIKSDARFPPTLNRMYGWFYPWFIYNGGARLFPRLGQEIFAHASTRIQVTRRAFSNIMRSGTGPVTLSEAASMAKVRPGTMRKLLSNEGLIRPEKQKGVPVLVERSVAERMAGDVAEAWSLTGLGDRLGLSRKALTKLVRSNIVPCWIDGGKLGQKGYLFRKHDVEKWLSELVGQGNLVRTAPRGCVNLANTPHSCRIATTVLVTAIMRGDIPVIALCGKTADFQTMWVNRDDVIEYRSRIGARAATDPLRNYKRQPR